MSFVLSVGGIGLMILGVSTYQSDPEFITPSPIDSHKVVASSEATVAPSLSYSEPAHIHIPSLNIDSTIMQVGKNRDNTMEVPTGESIDKAAWYQHSSSPGQIGSSVIVGHVTNDKGMPSIFYELGKLAIGESVVIEREDGSIAEFEVTGREIHPRDDFPDELVYGNQNEPSLRILTCGGMYDTDAHQYSDNVIVSAKLISATPSQNEVLLTDWIPPRADAVMPTAISAQSLEKVMPWKDY